MYEKVLVVSGKPSWNKEHYTMRAASFRLVPRKGLWEWRPPFPASYAPKSLMFSWSIVRYSLIARRRVLCQTLETPRDEATMRERQRELSQILKSISRAEKNGRSTDNVRPDRGLDRSNSGLAVHFDRSFLDKNIFFLLLCTKNF